MLKVNNFTSKTKFCYPKCLDVQVFCFKSTISKQQIKVLTLLHPQNLLQPVRPGHSCLKFTPYLTYWIVNLKLYQDKQLTVGYVFLNNDGHLQLQISTDKSAVILILIEEGLFLFLALLWSLQQTSFHGALAKHNSKQIIQIFPLRWKFKISQKTSWDLQQCNRIIFKQFYGSTFTKQFPRSPSTS